MDRQDNRKTPQQSDSDETITIAADEYATLVKNYKGFNIFIVDDSYYALTADYGELLPDKVVREQHSLASDSLLKLEDEVDTAIAFSNSRGNFNNQFRQKVKGAFMKAESVHDNSIEESSNENLPSGKVIYIEELNEYFFVTPDELASENPEDINSSFVNTYYASSQPELISTIGNYNLVSFDSKIFAVKQGIETEEVEWTTGFISQKPGAYSFNNTKDAIRYVKSLLAKEGGQAKTNLPASSSEPQLVGTDAVQKINYVFYRGLYYAIPQSLGQIDLKNISSSVPEGVIFSDSLDSLKQFSSQIDKASKTYIESGESDIPRLIKSDAGYNIVAFGGYYFAIPQSLEGLNLLETDVMSLPDVVRDVSIYVIEEYIAEQRRLKGDNGVPVPLNEEQQQAQLQELATVIAAMKTSKFWKLRSTWLQIKRSIGLPVGDEVGLHLDAEQPIHEQIKQARKIIAAMKTSKFWKMRILWFQIKKALRLTTEEQV